MRWLESAPQRYDAGMRLITLGRVAAVHDAIAEAAAWPGARVLEIGCGTGAVTLRLLERGAQVIAIDASPEMIEQARERLAEPIAQGRLEMRECTASEIDALPATAFDAVVASLVLSDMSTSEREFVLARSRERLRADGRIVVGDELRPCGRVARMLWHAMRLPQAAFGWLLAGAVSRPLADLRGELAHAGFVVRSERRWLGGSLGVFVAEPGEET
jgi:demethylmenaquinone methyltransferase/2-methoxy-6-polyprenyl-1,4-benzoquinol methylase